MCRTKVVQHGAFSGPLATEFTRHEAFAGSPAKNFARQGASTGVSAKKLARQAIKRHFWGIFRALGELFRAHANNKPCRENFVPDPGPVPVQNSPRTQPGGPTRYKTLPARPKYPFSAHFEPAGRVLYRFHHHQAEQGEESHAPTPHLTPPTLPSPISHAIHLNELSTKPRNVAIPTITIQVSKYSQGNCMRNWRGRIRGGRQGQGSNTRTARLEATAGPAGPGQAPRRRTEPDISDTSPTGVEGAGGSGGHGRASRSTTPSEARVWRSRGRPGPTAPRTPVGPPATTRSADGSRAGRRPRAHQAARPNKAHAAPRTPAAPQATPEIRRA